MLSYATYSAFLTTPLPITLIRKAVLAIGSREVLPATTAFWANVSSLTLSVPSHRYRPAWKIR